MKLYCLICTCLAINIAAAQTAADPAHSFEFHPEKFPEASIYLDSDSVVNGTIMEITDRIVLLSVYLNDTAKNKSFLSISISQIKRIRIKRNVAASMAGGAVITGLVGYGLGYISYTDDDTISDDDNKDRQQVRGAIGALIAAVPGMFIGMATSLFHKQNFVINGRNERMRKLMHALR